MKMPTNRGTNKRHSKVLNAAGATFGVGAHPAQLLRLTYTASTDNSSTCRTTLPRATAAIADMSTTGGTPVDRREREVSPEAAPLAAVVSELDLETVTMEELEALAGTVGGIPLEMSFSRSPSSALTATPSSSRSASSSRSPSLSVTPRVDEAQIRGGALGHQFALLEAAVREKDAMLANIGKQHLLELKVLQDQVRALMRERGELESRIDSADRRHAAALRAERRKADAAVGALREQLAALEERAPVVASRMALSTADIATLRVPTDAQYAKLSRTPASRRSIKAQLAVKVYELTEAIRADAVAADTRLHALDDTVESAKANVVRLTRAMRSPPRSPISSRSWPRRRRWRPKMPHFSRRGSRSPARSWQL